ncbi:MAG TPA: methionyl-tRNA formyltransferase [Bacteroidales bacterium]|nr:methionyl-tRNA formyltransferase [Bacteroidales bacterium]HPF02839.1 methionyl-tRNA formyltransferase [Bacteroidales bacterium]HPJ60237.1 methionyl-tRNA formyltransferase [Bacteroidales bacterium]HPR13440.1 methionyl-tRNA formyltransferase [Bacteroidales bacterium]HRW86384.1 methionyl-tRNA formyltransferase [Bacteroidales bacterium]
MSMKNLRIIFMGTSDFAVATLGTLLMNGFNVTAVVTAPDKPAGRGRKMKISPVKQFAELSSLPVMQPENLKDQIFIDALAAYKPDIFIVVAFRMLPEAVWKMPPMGTINLHASLLPHYRGAAPINWAVINGETMTGVTTFFIDEKIDTGKILLREGIHIFQGENAGDLHDRLMRHGARLVIRTLIALTEDHIEPQPQSAFLKPGEVPKEAPKIFPEHCIINWDQEPVQIHNFIRGLAPYPAARTFLTSENEKLLLKLFESHPENGSHEHKPGKIISDGKTYIKIACRNGWINILSLQAEGRKKLNTPDFLRGFDVSKYWLESI